MKSVWIWLSDIVNALHLKWPRREILQRQNNKTLIEQICSNITLKDLIRTRNVRPIL